MVIKGKSKGKVVSVSFLTEKHAIKAYWGKWRYSATHSLTSEIDGDEWSASRIGRFTPRERAPGTHWIGGWVGPRAVLDAVVKRKTLSPCRDSNPRSSHSRIWYISRRCTMSVTIPYGSILTVQRKSDTCNLNY
jgi:hypothetical protein